MEGQRLTFFRALSLLSLMLGHIELQGGVGEGQREQRDRAEVYGI